ncbi:uncharacterized protein LOC129787190 [Lutzomyia longipalpis]|uniref:uncharacterized protein LOC129787190 n=1 Tax=Lutzomyia longipalpis TaxID=7200 RepID=UPI002483F2C5|nr:uncharacterized protein LOC129787190 [Lutzomyia longipalpis]XP_055678538.1 uncharacterized protein LOC129787190 [Lutzomyia longipalpis]XP_055678539.1 uncharacterized protein LOC129787190 [Lutzomyia longipalpis]
MMDREASDSEGEGVELEMWCYTDPKGKPRGPFPCSKMLRWRAFFYRSTVVWRYGSKRQITFEDFLRIHKIHPLWTYFDEENEPLIETKETDSDGGGSDSEGGTEAAARRKLNFEANINSDGRDNTDEDSEGNGEKIRGEECEEIKWNQAKISSPKTISSKESDDSSRGSSLCDQDEESSADSEEYQELQNADEVKKLNKSFGLVDIDVDVKITDNLPDRYEKCAEVGKINPSNPLEFKPYPKENKASPVASRMSGKENVEPIEEIQRPQMYPQGAGRGYTQIPQNWNFRQMGSPQPYTPVEAPINYYRAVPPPLPIYMTNPPPVAWPMRSMEGPQMVASSAPVHVPPTFYYASQGQPIQPHMNTRALTYTSNTTPHYPQQNIQQQPYPPTNQYYAQNFRQNQQQQNYQQQNYQQQNYQLQNYQQNYQPGAVQELHQMYKQSSGGGNEKGMGVFCENLIQKYINITGNKMQELYQENEKLKMHNQELQQKKPQSIPVNNEISFAKMVSMDNKGNDENGDKKGEIKSFWDNVPTPKPTSVPYKKGKGFIEKVEKGGNKYPSGYVGDGMKKKKIQAIEKEGVEGFIEWCLETLNYISENKLNVEGLRVVLQELETIACVERYIKMWLDDFNPKMWVLFNEKLKKFRKEGMSDELNSPARANPYDIERQKQKEKMQKKAELFGQNVDLNTMNINRHLTKIQQFGGKKVGATAKIEK